MSAFAGIDGRPYRDWWCGRFNPHGDPFSGMSFYQRGRNNIWVGTADLTGLSSASIDAVGIHLLRIGRRYWKPTSGAIMAFAADARSGVVDLDAGEVAVFLAGGDVPLVVGDPRREGLPRGFLAARFHGVPLGCAEWHERGVLTSLVPKNKRVTDIAI